MARRVFSPDGDRYLEVRRGGDGQFYVHELDSNHEQLMVSEGYTRKDDAWRAARNSFREFFGGDAGEQVDQ